MEAKRQLDVLDRRLAESAFLAGDDYLIADMAVWPWYGALAKGLLYQWGEPSSQLHERPDANDFDTKTQEKLAAAQ